MQIRLLWVPLLIAASVGLSCRRHVAPLTVDSVKALTPQFLNTLTNALEHSRQFTELKYRAQRPMIFVDGEQNGWVRVDIGELSQDFFHRWATLKVETKTGRILSLSTDENLEDKWVIEHQTRGRPIRW